MNKWIRWIGIFLTTVSVFLSAAITTAAPDQQQVNACPKAPPTRLKKGALAKVIQPSAKEFPGAYLKSKEERAAPVLRYLPMGTVVEITDDPRCSTEGDRWYSVKVGPLTGLMAEARGTVYALEPFSGTPPAPLASTIAESMLCIALNPLLPTPTAIPPTPIPTNAPATERPTPVPPGGRATAPATAGAAPTATALRPTSTPQPTAVLTGKEITRVIYASEAGELMVIDNAEIPARAVAKFDPPPVNMALSPDGAAALVVTFNGLYWVDLGKGTLRLVADASKFGLEEGEYIGQVKWQPDQRSAVVEITKWDVKANVVAYSVWAIPLDGTFVPFPLDTGAQPKNGILRSPGDGSLIIMSNNDFTRVPSVASQKLAPLLEYVPRMLEGDEPITIVPAVTWEPDGKGFYTYIPISNLAPPTDTIGGKIWRVGVNGQVAEGIKPRNVTPADYVIPSGDGQRYLVLAATNNTWTIRNGLTGQIEQTIPAGFVFGWTPDSKGILYRSQANEAKFIGVDGSTESPYVPSMTGLYDMKWLSNGTAMYIAQGKDKKFSLSLRRPGKDPEFISIVHSFGIVNGVSSYDGAFLPDKPGAAIEPAKCK